MEKESDLRAAIGALCRADEAACVEALLPRAGLPRDGELRAGARARRLVETVRLRRREAGARVCRRGRNVTEGAGGAERVAAAR